MKQMPTTFAAGCALAGVLCVTAPATAQQQPAAPSQGQTTATVRGPVVVGQTAVATGKVTSINPARRVLTVEDDRAGSLTLVVGPEVKNFQNVKLGDRVTVQYTEATAIALAENPGKKDDLGAIRAKVEAQASSQPTGTRPGMGMTERTTMVANVFEVDRQQGTVTLRGTSGVPIEVQVPDKQVLQQIDKNDQVVMSYVEAAAVSIQPAAAAGNTSAQDVGR